MLAGEVVEFKTIGDAYFVVDARDVLFHRVFRDLKKVSDISVRHAVHHNRGGNLKLPRREPEFPLNQFLPHLYQEGIQTGYGSGSLPTGPAHDGLDAVDEQLSRGAFEENTSNSEFDGLHDL